MSSLDALSESEIEPLWLQEAAHRAAEMDQGLSKRIPAEEVRRQANALLKRVTSLTKPRALSAFGVEHLEHVAYYQSCQIGLGARYLLAFDEAMGIVCEAPDRYRVEFPPAIRKYRVPGFPYNILYRIVNSNIEVLVVAEHRRRPGYWLGKL